MPKTAILIGATGLTGSQLLKQLLNDVRYSTVKVLHRRSAGTEHPKLDEHIINFDAPEEWKDLVRGDHLFSALGTTLRKAGSEDEQYKIDNTYQYEVAKAAAENGVKRYALVSTVGAKANSNNFYLRMKGELDESIEHLGFEYTAIFRPSFLDGDRKEFRLGEKIGIIFAKLLSWIPGIRKYRPIPAETVARAMISDLNNEQNLPQNIYEMDEIFKLG
ncbi:NAD(P)H-binding protein [Balneola sp. MJW-20]|uniref:NAD(P)H-binding protein n=1 Tax=Gracilimonas aurantiaca TaxID=3234185 RepID=UPI00346706D4